MPAELLLESCFTENHHLQDVAAMGLHRRKSNRRVFTYLPPRQQASIHDRSAAVPCLFAPAAHDSPFDRRRLKTVKILTCTITY